MTAVLKHNLIKTSSKKWTSWKNSCICLYCTGVPNKVDSEGTSYNIFQNRADLTLYQHMGGYDIQAIGKKNMDLM